MAKKKITVLAEKLLSGFLQEERLELYHSEFVKEGKDWFLRIYIDKPEGEGYIRGLREGESFFKRETG